MTSEPYRRRWPALAALLLGEAMNLLDSTVVPVTGPAICADLAVSDATLQWLTAGYTLPFALLLIAGGRLGDVFGRRRVFVAGMLLFVASSAVCAGAPDATVLLSARAAQGVGAALIIPQTFGLIRAMFAGSEVARALGTIGPVMALSALCGPVAGGLLTDADVLGLGWRAVFLVNVPLGLAVLAAAPLIREDRSPVRPRLLLLVEPSLFRGHAFPASLAGSLLFFSVMNGLLFVLVLHLQLAEHQTPTAAALTLLPWSAGLAVGSWVAGATLVPRYGPRTMRAGLVLLLAGLAGLTVSLSPVPLLLAGLGLGVFTVPFFANALSAVTPAETGSASGLLNAVQQLGATTGVALLGALYFDSGTNVAVITAIALTAATMALTFPMLHHSRVPTR